MSKPDPVISAAAQRGNQVYLYDDRGMVITTIPGELVSFTGSSVTVQKGKYYLIYNSRGTTARSIPAGR